MRRRRTFGMIRKHTYGRSLRQAEARICEALAVWLDRDPDGLVIGSEWPAELEDVATKVSEARRNAAASAQTAGAATRSSMCKRSPNSCEPSPRFSFSRCMRRRMAASPRRCFSIASLRNVRNS